MKKFKEMNGTEKRNLFIVIGVVAVILLSLLIAFIVYAAPVKGKGTTEHWHAHMKYTDDYAVKTFEKRPGEDFNIMCIADTQLADLVEVGGTGDPLKEITMLIEKEAKKPDLIIVMGDITWTAFTKNSVKKFVKYMDKLGIPWAPILGNHEDEKEQGYFCHVDKNWVADQMMKSKSCLFRKGPNNIGGVGNYIINIKENDKVVESLIFMDSHAKRQYPEYNNGWYYDYIYPAQMLWYKWVLEGITANNGGVTPESMLYIHIPLPEYETAYDEYVALKKEYEEAEKANNTAKMAELEAKMAKYDYSGNNLDGIWGSNLAGDDKFETDEDKKNNCVNSGFFEDYIKPMNSTKYIYAGHDHKNNYSVLYEDVRLTYTTKTGYKCSYTEGKTGGTTITIGNAQADGISRDVTITHKYIKYDKKKPVDVIVDKPIKGYTK